LISQVFPNDFQPSKLNPEGKGIIDKKYRKKEFYAFMKIAIFPTKNNKQKRPRMDIYQEEKQN
jgi:hypothetical protein